MNEDELRNKIYDVVEDFYNLITSNDKIDVIEELDLFINRLNNIKNI